MQRSNVNDLRLVNRWLPHSLSESVIAPCLWLFLGATSWSANPSVTVTKAIYFAHKSITLKSINLMENQSKPLTQAYKDALYSTVVMAMEEMANNRVEGETYYYDKKELIEIVIELAEPHPDTEPLVKEWLNEKVWNCNDLEEYFND